MTDTNHPEGSYVFQFSYLDREGNERFEQAQINDRMSFEEAMVMAKKHASGFGRNKIQWLMRNDHLKQHGDKRYEEGVRETIARVKGLSAHYPKLVSKTVREDHVQSKGFKRTQEEETYYDVPGWVLEEAIQALIPKK